MENKEFIVKSVQEFIGWITTEAKESTVEGFEGNFVSFEHAQLYYRGQASKDWPVIAGIFRGIFDNNLSEHELLKVANLRLSNYLLTCQTYLEKLIFLQHYGLKTRLIDVTFNPLVALYFACGDHNHESKNGVVYCGFHYDREDLHIAELTAEFVFTYSLHNIEDKIISFAQDKKVRLYQFEKSLFVMPPVNNPRLEHQNGAFILSPLVKRVTDNCFVAFNEPIDEGCFFPKKAIVPKDSKKQLLKELNTLGINKGSIFQGVSDKIESIVQEDIWRIERISDVVFE